uniref:adenylate cyclase n=1 Tax=Plectus sambesii TaxID=2011161 RepID=A0A914WU16_9BILA
MAMDHAVKAATAKESALARLCRSRQFESKALETIYQKYSLASQRRTLIKVLWVFATVFLSLASLNVYFVRAPNVQGICFGALCALFIVLLGAVVQVKRNIVLQRVIVYATLQLLLVFVVLTLPINYATELRTPSADSGQRVAAADGAWSVVVAVFAVYTTLPVSWMLALAFGVATSLAQLIVAAVFVHSYEDGIGQQLTANLLLFVWTNAVGLYLHSVWNQILRAAFIDTRNCIAARQDIEEENEKLERLLSSALPQHVATAMRCDISQCANQKSRNSYIQQYENVSVIFADISGFQSIVSHCTAQDTVRIVNQIFARFDHLAKLNHCLRIRILGDAYLAVCGVPECRPDHAACCVKLGLDMIETICSIVEQTGADIGMRIGIDSGSAVCGVVGLKKWHYDVWSETVENAYYLQSTATPDKIYISQSTLVALEDQIDCHPTNNTDKFGRASYYVVNQSLATKKADQLLFHDGTIGSKAGHRLPFSSVSQCINHLLQSAAVTNNSTSTSFGSTLSSNGQIPKGQQQIWRKRRSGPMEQSCGNRVNGFLSQAVKAGHVDQEKSPLLNYLTLRFKNAVIERGFNQHADRWFVPAVAGCIPFLVIYSVFHALVLPHQITALLLIVAALAVMCAILSVLYIDYFKGFRLFMTRTFWGHSMAILLILSLLCTCGVINTFSCPIPGAMVDRESSAIYGEGAFVACAIPQYALLSCMLWLVTVAIFVRFSSTMALIVMLTAGAVYGIHVFNTHSLLYYNYSLLVHAAVANEHELILGIIALIALVFIQARRNEWAIRIDFLWKLQAVDEHVEMRELQIYNQRILFNLLPPHVACNFLNKTDPCYHGSHRVGVAFMNVDLKSTGDSASEATMGILNEIICQFDALLDEDRYRAVEKIKSVNSSYMIAVGLLPEFHANTTTADNYSSLLIPLADYALAAIARLKEFNAQRNTRFDLSVGIDCGSVIAGVIGSDRPQYDIWGKAVNRAKQLQTTADSNTIQVSDDVCLALRSAYKFEQRRTTTIRDGRSLVAYCLSAKRSSKESSPDSQQRPSPLRVYQGGISLPGLSEIVEAKNRLTAAILRAEPMSEDADDKESSPFLESSAARLPARNFSSSFAVVANKRPSIPAAMQTSIADSDTSNIEIEMADATTDGEHYVDVEEHQRIGRLQQLLAHAMRPSVDNETDALVQEMIGSMHSSYSSDLFSTDAYKVVPLESEEDLEWITPQLVSDHATVDRRAFQPGNIQLIDQSDMSDVGGPAMPPPSSVCSPLIKQQKMRKPKKRQKRNAEDSLKKRMSGTSQSDFEPAVEGRGYRPSPRLLSWLRQKSKKNQRSPLPLGVSEISDDAASDWSPDKIIRSPTDAEKRKAAATDELEAAAFRVDKMLLELSAVHGELPESDQAHYMSEQTNTGPRDSPLCRPFPTDPRTPYFMQSDVMSVDNADQKLSNNARQLRQPTSAAQTEYENADSDYPCSETESQLRGCSPDTQMMNRGRLHGLAYASTPGEKRHSKDDSAIGSAHPFARYRSPSSNLDYLGLDPGHEADIDSLCSSRASSRVFFDESLRCPFPQTRRPTSMSASRKSIGYDSEYDNFRNGLSQEGVFRVPSQISDMEIDFFDVDEDSPINPLDEMRKLARDIKQNFGDFKLASFSDVEK